MSATGTNKKFALIGASGFIAPRHFKAIRDTGNSLVAAFDPYDGVGIIDSFFPHADFFTEFERFDRHLDKLKRNQSKIDFLSICSPNYLHDSHVRFGLRAGIDVICEKPLVLNPWNLEALSQLEVESGKKVYSILQLRHHPDIIALKNLVDQSPKDKVFDVDLTYITSRGKWYYASWKGDTQKSGGIATNIGIHFFDMLSWIFGDVSKNTAHINTHDRASGFLEFSRARVRWFLSINRETLPTKALEEGKSTYRSITIEGKEIEFSGQFENLHTVSYQKILNGEGFRVHDAQKSIEIAHHIRNATVHPLKEDYHPLAALPLSKHPFL
jgi:UDP-N-acetyl-2-amino-2-deoxyglucuronate dehydrogenase